MKIKAWLVGLTVIALCTAFCVTPMTPVMAEGKAEVKNLGGSLKFNPEDKIEYVDDTYCIYAGDKQYNVTMEDPKKISSANIRCEVPYTFLVLQDVRTNGNITFSAVNGTNSFNFKGDNMFGQIINNYPDDAGFEFSGTSGTLRFTGGLQGSDIKLDGTLQALGRKGGSAYNIPLRVGKTGDCKAFVLKDAAELPFKGDIKITKKSQIEVRDGKTNKTTEAAGEEIKITAHTPATGRVFAGWEVVAGNITIENPSAMTTSFVMTEQDAIVRATYKDKTYTVTGEVNDPKMGTINPSGPIPYTNCLTQRFRAFPKDGFRLSHWKENGIIKSSEDRYNCVAITTDKTVTACFEKEDRKLNVVDAQPNETINIEKDAPFSPIEKTIRLSDDMFTDIAIGKDITPWFATLPKGLTIKVKDITTIDNPINSVLSSQNAIQSDATSKDSGNTMTVAISGTPRESGDFPLIMNIPGEYLESGCSIVGYKLGTLNINVSDPEENPQTGAVNDDNITVAEIIAAVSLMAVLVLISLNIAIRRRGRKQ